MKKIMTKIVGAFLGVAMAIGVGAVLAQNANAVYAETGTAVQSGANALTTTATAIDGDSHVTIKTSSANSYTSPARLYANTTVTINAVNATLVSVTYEASSTGNYVSYAQNATVVPNVTPSVSGKNVTWEFSNSPTQFTITPSAQTRWNSISVTYSTGGSSGPVNLVNPNPQYDDLDKVVSWTSDDNATKYQVKVDDGSFEDITTSTYDARNLSVGDPHTVYIKAVGDGTNFNDAEGSVNFTPTVYEVHRKFVVSTKTSVTETGDAITGATASFSQTFTTACQISAGNSMTLSLTGLTRKVTISKLVLSMHSNQGNGSGSISVQTDSNDPSFIEGTSSSEGVDFTSFGDNDSYQTDYVDVTWGNLSYLAKSSIEIKIYSTYKSLYCQSFVIFFFEEENTDYVSELTVSPNTWTGYDTSLLQVEDFTVSVTTGGVAGSAVDYTFLGIGYMDGENFVARDANFIYGYPQVADTRLAWKANYPTTAGGDTYLYAYVTLNVSADTIASVAISGNMTKTTYFTNDNWMYYGLTAEAVYASGNRINVTGFATYQYYSDSAMTNEVATPEALGAGENQKLYVKATYEGISNTVGYEQTVSLSVEHGSLITDPLTADEAITMGKDLQYATEKEYYIRGIISEIDTSSDHTNETCATFILANSDDTYDFEAFKVKYDANCTNHEDLQVGAEVLIKCQLRRVTINDKHFVENGSDNGVLLSISFTKPALEAITLNKTSLFLTVGEEFTLKASAYPLGADLDTVVWATLNNSVATVDQNGVVTAVALGSATITATSGEITATCQVAVTGKATMSYSVSTTTNMTGNNDAATLGLDADLFSVVGYKGGQNNYPGLNKGHYIALYASSGNGASIVVSVSSEYTISAINVAYHLNPSNATVYAGNTAVKGSAGSYTINSNSFTVKNTGSSGQLQIDSIEIFYREATAQDYVERLDTQTSLAYRYEKDGEGNFSYSDIVMRFGANISKDLWNELDTNEHNITGFGVILMEGQGINNMGDVAVAMEDMVLSTVSEDLNAHLAIDYFVPIANMNETIGSDDNNYFWNLRVSVAQSEMSKAYAAVAYIKLGDEYVLLNMANESVETLALDYMLNRDCDETTAGGSLQNIIDKAA